jgi:ribonuclease BN (tRNA processing enzyme)
MEPSITILGSGTLFPAPKRFPSSFLLETNETRMLLDCGHCAMARLTQTGIDVRDIDGIFLSHFHADHASDAFTLIHARTVGNKCEHKENKQLVFFGPRTLEERFKKWREIFWPEPDEFHPLEFHEGPGKYVLGTIKLELFPVKHVPWFESVGAIIEISGKRIVYPGDIGSDHDFDSLVETARNADLLMIEAAALKPSPNHFTTDQVAELSKRSNAKRTIIVHIRQSEECQKELEEFASHHESISLAEDGMKIMIKDL